MMNSISFETWEDIYLTKPRHIPQNVCRVSNDLVLKDLMSIKRVRGGAVG
jgi:hypothetical protein